MRDRSHHGLDHFKCGSLPLRWVNCRKLTASGRAAVLRVERGEEGLRVLLLLEYVRSDVAAGEGLPELHTHKGARSEAGNRRDYAALVTRRQMIRLIAPQIVKRAEQ